MLPMTTDLAPTKVGVAGLESRKRRFCSFMAPYLSYRASPWCDELGVAARSRIDVECRHASPQSPPGPVFGRALPVGLQPPAERLGKGRGCEHHGCLRAVPE